MPWDTEVASSGVLFFVFASVFPGLMEQSGVKIQPLPKEVKVYLRTTSMAPYCGEWGVCM